MKHTHNTAPKRLFRRWASLLLTGCSKHQDHDYLREIFEQLQEIEDSIEIIAREISRQTKRDQLSPARHAFALSWNPKRISEAVV